MNRRGTPRPKQVSWEGFAELLSHGLYVKTPKKSWNLSQALGSCVTLS